MTFILALTDRAYHAAPAHQSGLVGDTYFASQIAVNEALEVRRFVSLRDILNRKPPDYLPDDICKAFVEGAACSSIGCYNAAATMFRLCVDLVTKPLLPPPAVSGDPAPSKHPNPPNGRQRRDLGLRLQWLFDNKVLPSGLKELASCIREDANDGAHVGNLTKLDCEDIADFTESLLETLVTEPKRIELAEERRRLRREKPVGA